jgi:hypothetical protein
MRLPHFAGLAWLSCLVVPCRLVVGGWFFRLLPSTKGNTSLPVGLRSLLCLGRKQHTTTWGCGGSVGAVANIARSGIIYAVPSYRRPLFRMGVIIVVTVS